MKYPGSRTLTEEQMLKIIQYGLPPTPFPKKIIIAGAGIAGLVAAFLLKQAGHHVVILEASNRVGGRMYTVRSPFTRGQYFDAGAMRIPDTHLLTLAWIRKFGLALNPFVNDSPLDLIYVNGIRTRACHYQRNPDILNYPVAPEEKGKTAEELLQRVIQPIMNLLREDPEQNWDLLYEQFSSYSLEVFLRNNPFGTTLSKGAVEMVKVLMDLEGFPELSFVELIKDIVMLVFNPEVSFFEITGGADQLPRAFLPQLGRHIRFGERVTRIVQEPHQVTIHTVHEKSRCLRKTNGDLAIVTVPFTLLRFVDVEPRNSFSPGKWKAIRELHYVPSNKIGVEFRTRFWEKEGLWGGKAISDLPLRFTYYPSHGIGTRTPGVVLASYTWEDDALPWDSMSQTRTMEEVLQQMCKLHGKKVYREFVNGYAHSWTRDPYAAGAFAMFRPEQTLEFADLVARPEGRVYFAGEHTSNLHGWVEGAIQSAIRVADEVNMIPDSFLFSGKTYQ
ncbi:MAG: flavin monoamine oxidase family protein [Thermoactinomyces sp.]